MKNGQCYPTQSLGGEIDWDNKEVSSNLTRVRRVVIILVAIYLNGLVTLSHSAEKPKLRDTLTVKKGTIFRVAFSPDGTTLASCSGGPKTNTIWLWEVTSSRNTATLVGHLNAVTSVAFSPDGKTLASGSSDLTIKLWDTKNGQDIATLAGHTRSVTSLAFSVDGSTLASSAYSNVKLWNLTTHKCVATLQGGPYDGLYNQVAFSSNGKILATGSWKTIVLWDSATHKVTDVFRGHTHIVDSVAFSPNGNTLASGSSDNTIMLWNPSTGKKIGTLAGHNGHVRSLAFSPDGKVIASGGSDSTARLWDIATGECTATFKLDSPYAWYVSVAYSPDGKTLAVASGREINLWDVGRDDAQDKVGIRLKREIQKRSALGLTEDGRQ